MFCLLSHTCIVVLFVTVLLLLQFFACCPVGFQFIHSCLVRSRLPGIVVLVSLFVVLTVFAWQLRLLCLSVFCSCVCILVSPYRSACVTVCCYCSLVHAVYLFRCYHLVFSICSPVAPGLLSIVVLVSLFAAIAVICWTTYPFCGLLLLSFHVSPSTVIPVLLGSRFLLIAFPKLGSRFLFFPHSFLRALWDCVFLLQCSLSALFVHISLLRVCSVMFLFYMPCLSPFFCDLVIAACCRP